MANYEMCDVYIETLQKYPKLAAKMKDFIQFKTENPSRQFGSSDYPFQADGPLGKMKIKHAHLSQDVSILYKMAGSPTTLYLYGLFSHNESGTGNTKNNKIQKSLATRLGNQFPELKDDFDYENQDFTLL